MKNLIVTFKNNELPSKVIKLNYFSANKVKKIIKLNTVGYTIESMTLSNDETIVHTHEVKSNEFDQLCVCYCG